MVGNEVLDAMPVHLMSWDRRRVAGARRRSVAPPTALRTPRLRLAGPPRPLACAPHREPDSEFVPGTVTETHGQAEAFVATLAERMTAARLFSWTTASPKASTTCLSAPAAR
jgi:SAM-dependent MidA family methyltransferase